MRKGRMATTACAAPERRNFPVERPKRILESFARRVDFRDRGAFPGPPAAAPPSVACPNVTFPLVLRSHPGSAARPNRYRAQPPGATGEQMAGTGEAGRRLDTLKHAATLRNRAAGAP